jgi:hypothetical protein
VIVKKAEKISTKCALNPKRKFKYKIGIGHDGKRNSALKRKKIMPDYYTSGTPNGLHGTIGTVNGTMNGLQGTIGTVNRTLNGLHGTIRTENGTLNGLHRTIGTVNRTLNGLHGTIRTENGWNVLAAISKSTFRKLSLFIIVIITIHISIYKP